jgi:TrmH family RNA methyltransferase
MPVRLIESKDNARLKELRKALAAPGRGAQALEGGAGGLVGIEGPKLLEEALRAGLRVKTIFVAQDPNRGSDRLLDKLHVKRDVEVLELPKKLLDQALATETPQSIAALVEPPNWSWSHVLNQNQKEALIVVLAGIQDPGNLGTILRSAEAFGATGVVSLPGTVSAWNAKAVRASAGSVFRVPLLATTVEEAMAWLREAGVKVLATTALGAKTADLTDLTAPLALVIGNEGGGVPGALAARADGTITIPCPGPVESLNAAVAASVLLYEASRQRATRPTKSFGNPQLSSKASSRGAAPHAAENRGARR